MANRHPTGWMSNSERALTQVAFRLPQQTVDQLKHAAALAGSANERHSRKPSTTSRRSSGLGVGNASSSKTAVDHRRLKVTARFAPDDR